MTTLESSTSDAGNDNTDLHARLKRLDAKLDRCLAVIKGSQWSPLWVGGLLLAVFVAGIVVRGWF